VLANQTHDKGSIAVRVARKFTANKVDVRWEYPILCMQVAYLTTCNMG